MRREYNRIFIALKQEESAVGAENKNCLGSVIIETRGYSGKLNMTAQNLEPKTRYTLLLISVIGEYIEYASLLADPRGKAAYSSELDSDDINASGFSVGDIYGVALADISGEVIKLIISGCKDGNPLQKRLKKFRRVEKPSKVSNEETTKEIETIKESIKETIEESIKESIEEHAYKEPFNIETELPLYFEEASVQKEIKPKEDNRLSAKNNTPAYEATEYIPVATVSFDDTAHKHAINTEEEKQDSVHVLKIADLYVEEEESIYPYSKYQASASETSAEKYEKPKDERLSSVNNFKELIKQFDKEMEELLMLTKERGDISAYEYNNNFANKKYDKSTDASVSSQNSVTDDAEDYAESLFKTYPYEKLFPNQNPEIAWIRIDMTTLGRLPINEFSDEQKRFITNSYSKNKHFIFGRNTQFGEIRYMLGVPGVYDKQISKAVSELGFHHFRPTGQSKLKNGASGYWLMVD